jgi:hypothetical protein
MLFRPPAETEKASKFLSSCGKTQAFRAAQLEMHSFMKQRYFVVVLNKILIYVFVYIFFKVQ